MGSYFPPHEGHSHIRVGPDWSSFVINWMTRWERFEDEKYRDKLLHSIDSLKKAPLGMASGSTFHYDPTTGEMHYMGAPNPAGHEHLGDGNYQQPMVICFGGPETWFELVDLLRDEEFTEMFAQLCSYYPMTPAERTKASAGLFNDENMGAWSGGVYSARMAAYSGYRFDRDRDRDREKALDYLDPSYHKDSTSMLDGAGGAAYVNVPAKDSPRPLREIPGVTTNVFSQWSLNAMEVFKLCEMDAEQNGRRK